MSLVMQSLVRPSSRISYLKETWILQSKIEIEDFILKNSAKNRSEITLKRKEKRRNAESRRERKQQFQALVQNVRQSWNK